MFFSLPKISFFWTLKNFIHPRYKFLYLKLTRRPWNQSVDDTLVAKQAGFSYVVWLPPHFPVSTDNFFYCITFTLFSHSALTCYRLFFILFRSFSFSFGLNHILISLHHILFFYAEKVHLIIFMNFIFCKIKAIRLISKSYGFYDIISLTRPYFNWTLTFFGKIYTPAISLSLAA